MQNAIIVVQPDSISKEAKEKLEASGIVIIETKDPNKIRILSPIEFGSAGDVFMAAMKAAESTASARDVFAAELLKRIRASEEKPNSSNIDDQIKK